MGVKIDHLSKSWPPFQIRDVDLSVADGEYFVILGPTGAGKTLLLELIVGFHRPDSGRIWINDQDVTLLSPEKRNVGFVFQDYALFPHLTVTENVEFGLRTRGMPKAERVKTVKKIIDFLGISHCRDRLPTTLSGGEQQKTALARALVTNPLVFLLDEPLSALDQTTQERLRSELRRIHRELGITTVHVTHNHAEAFMLASRMGVMRNGSIVQVGAPDEVFRRPRDSFVADFVGFENMFKGKVIGKERDVARIDIGGLEIEALTDRSGSCTVGIRPDDIIVSKRVFRSSVRNMVGGKVVDLVDMGTTVKLMVDIEGIPFTALVTKRSFVEMKLKKGYPVYLSFKASSVSVM